MIAAALLACAANVSPVTLEAVIRVESHGNPLAVNVNHLSGPQPHPGSVPEAASSAESYIRGGYSVDLGLMQVNSRNLSALGYSIAQMFDPCTNIGAGGAILTTDYAEAARRLGEGQPALKAALSAYNTGDFTRGLGSYVRLYYGSGGVPALGDGVQMAAASSPSAPLAPRDPYRDFAQAYAVLRASAASAARNPTYPMEAMNVLVQ